MKLILLVRGLYGEFNVVILVDDLLAIKIQTNFLKLTGVLP